MGTKLIFMKLKFWNNLGTESVFKVFAPLEKKKSIKGRVEG